MTTHTATHCKTLYRPTHLGGGWKVSVQGCCRIAHVLNNGGSSWALSTIVDLQVFIKIHT